MPKSSASDGEVLSWQALWQYLGSSRCTDEMRRFTLRYMYLRDALDGAMPWVQEEILEYAPDYVWEDENLKDVIVVRRKEVRAPPTNLGIRTSVFFSEDTANQIRDRIRGNKT
jgi:hypothetical protein